MSSGTLPQSDNLACDHCGQLGAYAFDGHALCAECYQERGSSCGGGAACDDDEEGACASEVTANETSRQRSVNVPATHQVHPNCCD